MPTPPLPDGALLGKGNFGTVYLRYDSQSAPMAVKEVQLTPVRSNAVTKAIDDLVNEITLMKKLDHVRIVKYIKAEEKSNILCIYMEYLPGGSVRDEIKNGGPFSENKTRKYTLQILEGLFYLHEKLIIHRDVKGCNILCDGDDNIKLADFGLSKQMTDLETMSGNSSKQGTVHWMSPQVILGEKYGRRADIWSTGATIVEMLTGFPPWIKLKPFQAMQAIAMQKRADYVLDSPISEEAKDFLSQTFTPEEEQRPRPGELLQHPWLQNVECGRE